MNLNTIIEVKRPTSADQISKWHEGYAWLAGGTWLFSEPQPSTDTLIDLEELRGPALRCFAELSRTVSEQPVWMVAGAQRRTSAAARRDRRRDRACCALRPDGACRVAAVLAR
jgi:hypothetical protein